MKREDVKSLAVPWTSSSISQKHFPPLIIPSCVSGCTEPLVHYDPPGFLCGGWTINKIKQAIVHSLAVQSAQTRYLGVICTSWKPNKRSIKSFLHIHNSLQNYRLRLCFVVVIVSNIWTSRFQNGHMIAVNCPIDTRHHAPISKPSHHFLNPFIPWPRYLCLKEST